MSKIMNFIKKKSPQYWDGTATEIIEGGVEEIC